MFIAINGFGSIQASMRFILRLILFQDRDSKTQKTEIEKYNNVNLTYCN